MSSCAGKGGKKNISTHCNERRFERVPLRGVVRYARACGSGEDDEREGDLAACG